MLFLILLTYLQCAFAQTEPQAIQLLSDKELDQFYDSNKDSDTFYDYDFYSLKKTNKKGDKVDEYEVMHERSRFVNSFYHGTYQDSKKQHDPFDTYGDFLYTVTGHDKNKSTHQGENLNELIVMSKNYSGTKPHLAGWAKCMMDNFYNDAPCKGKLYKAYVEHAQLKKEEHLKIVSDSIGSLKTKQFADKKDRKKTDEWIKCMEALSPTYQKAGCFTEKSAACEKDKSGAVPEACAEIKDLEQKIEFIQKTGRIDSSKWKDVKCPPTYSENTCMSMEFGCADNDTACKSVQKNIEGVKDAEFRYSISQKLFANQDNNLGCKAKTASSPLTSASLYSGGKTYDKTIRPSMANQKIKDQDGVGVCYAASTASIIESEQSQQVSFYHLGVMHNESFINQGVSKTGGLWIEGGGHCGAYRAAQKYGVCPMSTSWLESGQNDPACDYKCQEKLQYDRMVLVQKFFEERGKLSDADRKLLEERIKASVKSSPNADKASCMNPDIQAAYDAFKVLQDLAGDSFNAADKLAPSDKSNAELMSAYLFPTCNETNKIKLPEDKECSSVYDIRDTDLPMPARRDILHNEIIASLEQGKPLPISYCLTGSVSLAMSSKLGAPARTEVIPNTGEKDANGVIIKETQDKKVPDACPTGAHAVIVTGIKHTIDKGCVVEIWNSWGGGHESLKANEIPLNELADQLIGIEQISKKVTK